MAAGTPTPTRDAIRRWFAPSPVALAVQVPAASRRTAANGPWPAGLAQALVALPLAAIVFVQSASFAQQPVAAAPPAAAAPSAPASADSGPTQQELDQLVAPIALYPDNLIAQILMAATYPLEIVEAYRWAEANKTLKDQALQDAVEKQPWDPAVKAIVSVPQVLKHMNDNLSWMQKLGDAVLYDQAAVLKTVQALRGKAQTAGTLKSTAEQTVKTETQDGKTVYIIEPAKPDVVYVPTYDPAVVYGGWPYPAYPPYSMYPPYYAYPYGGALAFTAGVFVGAAIWGNCNWGGNNININNNNFNKVNHNNIGSGNRGGNSNWSHNADHRKGVAYNNQRTAQQYGRGNQGAQGRDQYRGRDAGAGANRGAGVSDRSAGANRGAGVSDRSAGANRGAGGGVGGGAGAGDRGAGGGMGGASASNRGSSGGFSGAGGGASTSQASSRGSASRSSSMGGGYSGGGSRGGGYSGGGSRGGGGGGGRGGGGGGRGGGGRR
jgi:hypothetical protein